MPFYTRGGDDGTTGLLGKGRVPKSDPRVEALGTLDEASAALGLARASVQDERCQPILLEVQRDLYLLMAEVASTPENAAQFQFDANRVDWLEQQIDTFEKTVQVPAEFIVPGDTFGGAALSVSRAVVRRAERRIIDLAQKQPTLNPALQRYLNRLSSLLFVLELAENQAAGHDTTHAKKPDQGRT